MTLTIDPPTHTLTAEQLDEYDRLGYTLVKGLFTREQMQQVNDDMDAYIDANGDASASVDKHKKGWVMSLARTTELASTLAEDERVLDRLEALVHPGIAIYSAKLVSKEPFDDAQCHWHQDDMYYTKVADSACRLSTYIALQDITVDQGCLQVIPGSHKRGLAESEMKDAGTCRLSMTEPPAASERQYVPMEAGDMLIFSALLQHGSEGNPTARRRRAFIVSYQEATAKAGNGKQWKILREA